MNKSRCPRRQPNVINATTVTVAVGRNIASSSDTAMKTSDKHVLIKEAAYHADVASLTCVGYRQSIRITLHESNDNSSNSICLSQTHNTNMKMNGRLIETRSRYGEEVRSWSLLIEICYKSNSRPFVFPNKSRHRIVAMICRSRITVTSRRACHPCNTLYERSPCTSIEGELSNLSCNGKADVGLPRLPFWRDLPELQWAPQVSCFRI